MSQTSPGARFRAALAEESPLQVIGAINANHALLAKRAGYRAIYLSGGGVAAGSLGLPDRGINTLEDVLIDVRRITDVCDLPLLVDIDTGFGPSAFNIERTVKSLIKAGAAVEVPADGDDTPEHSADGEAMDGDDSDAQVADVQTDTDTEDTDEGEGDDEDAEAPTQESGAPLKGAGIAEWRKYAKKHSIDTANLSKQQIIAAVVAAES